MEGFLLKYRIEEQPSRKCCSPTALRSDTQCGNGSKGATVENSKRSRPVF
jgi:hypothetical protein